MKPAIPMDEEPVCRLCGREHAAAERRWQCKRCGDLVCFAQLWAGSKEPHLLHLRNGAFCGPVRGGVLDDTCVDPP